MTTVYLSLGSNIERKQNIVAALDALAEKVAALVMSEFNVPWIKLRLSKPGAVRGARDVGMLIERGEKPK